MAHTLQTRHPVAYAYMVENAPDYFAMIENGLSDGYVSSTGPTALSQYYVDIKGGDRDFPYPDSYEKAGALISELEEAVHNTNIHLWEAGVLEDGGGDKYILHSDPKDPEWDETEEVYEDDVYLSSEAEDALPSAYWSGIDKMQSIFDKLVSQWETAIDDMEKISFTLE